MNQVDGNTEAAVNLSPRRWVWFLISLTVLGAVAGFLWTADDTVDVSQNAEPAPAPLVSVAQVFVKPETARIEVFGEVKPRWSAEIRAAVSGRVTEVKNRALAGGRVSAGQALFEIEKTQYEADVATAELELEQAKLALLQAQLKTELARRQFRRDGTDPPHHFALRLPQLRVAEFSVASAERKLTAAQKHYSNTVVTAPFSGIVTERFVSLGQSVTAGDRLARLVDDRRFELAVEVSRENWDLMQQPVSGQTAEIFDQKGKPIAVATARQGGGFLDQRTRQFRVFLDLTAAENGSVLSGDFVRVVLPGRKLDATISIPETALTREGYIWFVDSEEQLRRHIPNILFRNENRIVIAAPKGEPVYRVAITPLASFLPKQWVQPLEAGE
ncbi:efflux RND transporter periplasmic adaptor subunit [Pelagibius sp. Alg239-R121]|uniref:efflux RND transporter periplasmic adaptor subunit n=1 Tax=Pelagibius sp. Alg239-R121 TaxID=2993448 RepID=UPI0024A714C1|nr:efflux RND transporter periplasmic adaptor subunit [Pelagibius sp. Alg239-R121]